MLPIALVLGVWLWRRAPERRRTLDVCVPGLRAAGVGAAIVAALGSALNDSGIAVPGVMIAIAIASVVWLLTRFEPPSENASSDDTLGARTMVGVPA